MRTIFAKTIAIATTTASVSIASLIANPAQAASFTSFSFKTNVTASPNLTSNPLLLNDPTRDIRLDSVEFNGNILSDFELVTGAKILRNDTYINSDGSVYGVLHSGRGPNTPGDSFLPEGPSKPNPTDQDIVDTLGNVNLNSILVTRENADTAIIEVSFDNAVNTFFFWERGGTAGGSIAGDSDLLVEALDNSGGVIGSYKILRNQYTNAGYNISTQVNPILNNGPFNIGSIGITLEGITTKTLRLTSSGNNVVGGDNGPDFKVIAAKAKPVPEPTTILGILMFGSLGSILKHRRRIAD